MSGSEEAFGVPAGHSLRLVRAAPRGGDAWEWEHEERDRDGRLVAVYASWSPPRGAAPPAWGRGGAGSGGFVKYSPHGWVLRRSDEGARRWAPTGEERAPPPTSQPPSLRWSMGG